MQPAMKQSVRTRIPASLQMKLGDTPNRCGAPSVVFHPFNILKALVRSENWHAAINGLTGR